MNRHRRYGSAQAAAIPPGLLRACERDIEQALRLIDRESRHKLKLLSRERVGLLLEHAESHLVAITEGSTTFGRLSGKAATWLIQLANGPTFTSYRFALRCAAWARVRDTNPRLFPTVMSYDVRVVNSLMSMFRAGGEHRRERTRSQVAIKIAAGWIDTYMIHLTAVLCRLATRHSRAFDKSKAELKDLSTTLLDT